MTTTPEGSAAQSQTGPPPSGKQIKEAAHRELIAAWIRPGSIEQALAELGNVQ